jgi:hypothetical protein
LFTIICTFLLQVIRLSHRHYLDVIENALSDGSTVLLENIGETVSRIEFQRLPRVQVTEHKDLVIRKNLVNVVEMVVLVMLMITFVVVCSGASVHHLVS